jgi:2-octaprenyl-6-methoxyphenol hydroxylase
VSEHYDILIVGAGLVGASLALSLANTSLRIAISEINSLQTSRSGCAQRSLTNCQAIASRQPDLQVKDDTDGRSIALTYNSTRLLEKINVWSAIKPHATPINTVHVSHKGHFGMTRFHARDENVPALGYVVPAQMLGEAIQNYLLENSINKNISLFNPAKVELIKKENGQWKIQLSELGSPGVALAKPGFRCATLGLQISANLIIAADGTQSTLRSLLNIKTEIHDYQQSAIATTVRLNRAHQNIAYERFLNDGAIALLPRAENTCALIWTAANKTIDDLMRLDDQNFLQQAQQQFGYRLGKLHKISKRFTYPLKMIAAQEQVREGFVLLGNAAHTVHPIAAQGFNLGLSDVDVLTSVLLTAGKNFADMTTLQAYVTQRTAAQKNIIKFTDSLIKLFARDFLPFNMARSCGLLALDFLPIFKHRVAGQLMGIGHA